jgi:hypothetical protein
MLEGYYTMKTDKELIEEIRGICESIINLDGQVMERSSDDHIETCEIILNLINSRK